MQVSQKTRACRKGWKMTQTKINCRPQSEKSIDIFAGDYSQRKKAIAKLLDLPDNFDILVREMLIGEKKVILYAVDGFLKGDISQKVLEYFCNIGKKEMPEDFDSFVKQEIPYADIVTVSDQETFIHLLLSGLTCLLVDGYEEILAIDFREYPSRSVDEPETDKVLRGSRDGFLESVVPNAALIRRRIRDINLQFRIFKVGKSSRTDVAISYMMGRVKESDIEGIVKRIENVGIDALSMNQESLAEILFPRKWWNPFPKFKYTERPDTASAAILEGSIAILVDNSPAVMLIPTSLFSILEDANDYYFPPITGTYLRFTRMATAVTALFVTPLFLLFFAHPDWLPDNLHFLLLKDTYHIHPLLQFLILEFAIDGLKMASINTPNMLTTPLSIVAGIVFGDYTVDSGLFNSEIMLYMAFVAVANYTQSNMELGYAIKFHRMILLVLTGLFGIYGFVIGTLLLVFMLVFNSTFAGRGYLYPLIPFHGKQFLKRFFRVTLSYNEKEKNYWGNISGK